MEKISNIVWSVIGIALLIISGLYTAQICYDWLSARSVEYGKISDLEITEYVEEKDNYTITYYLDGGTVEYNPTKYNLFTETFTLNNPTKQGYEFLGWTNSNLLEPTLTVTICQGSAGDIEFTANYLKYLDAPEIEFYQSNRISITWQAVDKATAYIVNANGKEYKTTELFYGFSSSQIIAGQNTFKVKAVCETSDKTIEGPYSNEITYYVAETLTAPTLTITDNDISFSLVDGAWSYDLIAGNEYLSVAHYNFTDYGTVENGVITIPIYEDDSILGLFYSQSNLDYFNSNNHAVPVSIKAISYSDVVASATSNIINFEYPEFDKFNSLNIQANYQTVDMIADKGLTLDNNQYLCLLLRDSTVNLFDNTKYLSLYAFTVEISLNDEVVQTSLLNFGAPGVLYTKLNNLENLATYTVTLKFTNNYHDNYFVECFEIDFVLNTSQVWCLSI